jgi:hypothetical protein
MVKVKYAIQSCLTIGAFAVLSLIKQLDIVGCVKALTAFAR